MKGDTQNEASRDRKALPKVHKRLASRVDTIFDRLKTNGALSPSHTKKNWLEDILNRCLDSIEGDLEPATNSAIAASAGPPVSDTRHQTPQQQQPQHQCEPPSAESTTAAATGVHQQQAAQHCSRLLPLGRSDANPPATYLAALRQEQPSQQHMASGNFNTPRPAGCSTPMRQSAPTVDASFSANDNDIGGNHEVSHDNLSGHKHCRQHSPPSRREPHRHPIKYTRHGFGNVAPSALLSTAKLELLCDLIRGAPCPKCEFNCQENPDYEPGSLLVTKDDISEAGLAARLLIHCSKPKCTHRLSWSSGPDKAMAGRLETATKQAICAALNTGMGYTQFSEFSDALGFRKIDKRDWMNFQQGKKGGGALMSWQDAVLMIVQERRWKLYDEIKKRGRKVVLVVDARYDSSRNAFHGTLVFMDQESRKVLHTETLFRDVTGSSWVMEDAGFHDGMEELSCYAKLPLGECVHDDKKSIDAQVGKLLYEIFNSKDLWHCTKSKQKEFTNELVTKKRERCRSVAAAQNKTHLRDMTVPILKAWIKEDNKDMEDAGLDVDRSAIPTRKEEIITEIWSRMVRKGIREGDGNEEVSSLAYPELSKHNLTKKLRTHIYTMCADSAETLLGGDSRTTVLPSDPAVTSMVLLTVQRIVNAADHWAGLHVGCANLLKDPPCCKQGTPSRPPYYCQNGATHLAVKRWLISAFPAKYVKYLLLARMNYDIETFNSVIGKYAPKRIHYHETHLGRVGCAELDWNENIHRQPPRILDRKTLQDTTVRKRGNTIRNLPPKSLTWKQEVWRAMTEITPEMDCRRRAYFKFKAERQERAGLWQQERDNRALKKNAASSAAIETN